MKWFVRAAGSVARNWPGCAKGLTIVRNGAASVCRRNSAKSGTGAPGGEQVKNIAARALVEILAGRGLLVVPAIPLQRSHPRSKPSAEALINGPTDPICEPLRELAALQWILPSASTLQAEGFNAYLQRHHYLRLRVSDRYLKYLVRDKQGRDVACLFFGQAPWRAVARDQFVGWDQTRRAAALHHLANNIRYLILLWVKVAGLASQFLGQRPGGSMENGKMITAIPSIFWRALSSQKDLAAFAIERSIGCRRPDSVARPAGGQPDPADAGRQRRLSLPVSSKMPKTSSEIAARESPISGECAQKSKKILVKLRLHCPGQ
jgi:hypothetical protein